MIRFIYTSDQYNRNRELIAENVFRIMSEIIDLPSDIEIEFSELKGSIYGETLLDNRYKNRIRLHHQLTTKEVIVPLIHELLHVNQVHTGKLSGRRDGSFMWNKKVYHVSKIPTMDEWRNLPWEIDVAEKEKQILTEILSRG